MATPDAHANFAYSTVLTAPSPDDSGTSLVVQSGDGTKFPTVPFNATVWPAGAQPTSTTAEIVRVTTIATDTFTITRAQESTTARHVAAGWQIAAAITTKTLTDIETNYVNSWAPYFIQTGTVLQTLIGNFTSQTGTASLIVFPFTLQPNARFNQIIVGNSLSYVTSTVAEIRASYYSKFGLYSMSANTILNLISSNSFSIAESVNSVSLTWNYPTTTATSGYGYGSFPAGNLTATAQMSSFISGTRAVGLQFGGEMSLSGGMYWLGLMLQKSTSLTSTFGLSHAGIIGQALSPINQPGSVSGLLPLGIPGGDFGNINTSNTAWFGRQLVGILTATSLPNFGGTKIPNQISISMLGAAGNNLITMLPSITLVST